MFTFLPRDDPKQALRIRRLSMAGGSYLMMFTLMFLAGWLGLLDQRMTVQVVAAGTLVNLLLYAAIRSGFNLRFRDPSLTALQVSISLAMVSYGMYFADTSRGVFLLVYLVVILFGIFQLSTRAMMFISAYALASYGLVIALARHYKPQATNIEAELLQWAVLGAILPWFALFGGYLNNLRRNMRDKNTQLQSALVTIREMAVHDELTGAHNRWYLMDRLRQESARSNRAGSPLCVCIMDIDFFKKINDTHGHVAGDKVLQAFSEISQVDLRTTDCFARYGGEEFVLLMVDTSLRDARAVAERIRARVAKAAFPGLGLQSVTASFGVAQYQPSEDIKATLERADGALYRAKSTGRNRVECAEVTGLHHHRLTEKAAA